MSQNTRIEHDFLGERELDDSAYYGVQTLRALDNFHITGIPISSTPLFIKGLAYVKKAAALANKELEVIEPKVADAICKACDSIIVGELIDQFKVDVLQGGAGTSTNMNANEVIANKALEILGEPKGNYDVVHPNNHVNFSQSTNDAYPTAFRISLFMLINELLDSMNQLEKSFSKKGEEFKNVLKMGRTQLQDAVPMSLGQEFNAFSDTIKEDIKRVEEARDLITEINLGATAIGTRVNAPIGYPELATKHLAEITNIPVTLSPNLVEATSDTGAYVQISGVFKRVAVKISKICNDLRLLSSGPRAGLNEINLPRMQPGSSIMPGKVNPVIPEVMNQIAFQVIGTDVTISLAAEGGQLQLNVMEPVIAYNLFNNIQILKNGFNTLREKCIDGITANEEICKNMVLNSIGIVTQLNPIIGYENSASIAKEALQTGGSIYDIVLERKLMTKEKLDEVLSVENLMNPKFINK
ncbi:aspartate ammonia-lyase [Aureibacter tunicatorum]|uniref:Aspartate ammonia-lyase n=1 Tax=Aureibacter tunicatorum TaxID=866807 RepID=A0AAE4BT49_9BACT|nr:aspartate ammonia-lyase [Aureibacter tunicatorum]MDR6239590.1 aspartate ammonia-lyase [Aureibacter tunicatorum]BDD04067.1 aspartate ammonia-lyase [Aureibacter tunicatorum]